MGNIEFGSVISPVGVPGTPDADQYAEAMIDADLVKALGYDALWVIEHHFSDYFPTPSPLIFVSHLAARIPDIDLGTCVVVLPWYKPMRLAGEIAMLSHLTRGRLHLGLGRGLARKEYEAHGVNMAEARQRFRECYEIISRACEGGEFTYQGEFFNVKKPVQVRPRPVMERINFYGAMSSPETAALMAEMGLPLMHVSNFPFKHHTAAVDRWSSDTAARGGNTDVRRPILIHAVLADTDAEAVALAKEHLTRFNAMQAKHYEADADPWKDVPGYEAFSRFMANVTKLADPEQIGPWLDFQLVGSADWVCTQLQRYIDLGFNHFILQNVTYGMPRDYRHDVFRRFAEDVVPRFRGSPRKVA